MTSRYKRVNGHMVPVGEQSVFKSAAQIQEELNMPKVNIDVDVEEVGDVDWPRAWNKAWRTALQAGLATLVATFPTTLGAVHDLSAVAAAAVSLVASAVVAGLAAGAAVIHNTLEDKGIIKDRKVQ